MHQWAHGEQDGNRDAYPAKVFVRPKTALLRSGSRRV